MHAYGAHVIITARASKIVMEMKLGSVQHATFSIISAENALETALFSKKKRKQKERKQKNNKFPGEYTVNTAHFSPFQNYKIGSERVGSGVSAPLLEWCRNDSVYTGQRAPPQSLISYFSRCSQAGAWDPALYIPARHRVCCMMEGGGCSGPARLILSHGRGVNSRLYCCLGLPGFPWEYIQRGIDVVEEGHHELFIEQVKRRGEERMRRGVRKEENKKRRNGRVWKHVWVWRSQPTASTEIWVDVVCSTCWTEWSRWLLVWPAGAKANKVCLNLLIYGRESSRRG